MMVMEYAQMKLKDDGDAGDSGWSASEVMVMEREAQKMKIDVSYCDMAEEAHAD